jgi:PAS domain S-box-containing protein
MSRSRFQSAFLQQLADPAGIRAIFEHLPDTHFFIKDRDGRMIAASSAVLHRLGMKRESDFIGKLDGEVYPPHLAEAYRADDQKVLKTGRPLLHRLEVWLDESGHPGWCVTTKLPLRGKNGSIIGVMGVSRKDPGGASPQLPDQAMRVVEWLRQHARSAVSTQEIARGVNMSERTLNRRINESFGIPPYELALRIRIQSAAETLLDPQEEIASVALAHGFCDQSAFTRHFRKRMGMTPRKFRAQHQNRRATPLGWSRQGSARTCSDKAARPCH